MNELSPRLQAITDFLGINAVVADIGCDHGLVSLFLAENNMAKKIYASDISAPSLEKARQNAAKAGLEQIEFCCGNGFAPLPHKPDAAVIAGMGGDTIAKIIQHPFARTRLVLQPMRDAVPVYEALPALHMHAEKIRIVREGRRFYEIILALPGTESFLWTERVVLDDTAFAYWERKKFFLMRALQETEHSASAKERCEAIKQEIARIEEVIENGNRS